MDLKQMYSSHPIPQFARKDWESLCGDWDFRFDWDDSGEDNGFFLGFEKEYKIVVPFTYESKKSGIGKEDFCPYVWYQKKFTRKPEEKKRAHLIFEGADYFTKVWVNGQYIGYNSGAYHAFSFDIENALREGENIIVVKCEDSFSPSILRGKQRTSGKNSACFYVQMTGIWKPVWIEYRNRTYIENVSYRTYIRQKELHIHYEIAGIKEELLFETEIVLNGAVVKSTKESITNEYGDITVCLTKKNLPNCFWGVKGGLYDIIFRLKRGNKILDEVYSYFGMRELSIRNNAVCLNNSILNQKLLLYQGIWKDSLYTAPDDDTIVRELTAIKELGYNGIRVHEKIESERFLYHADKLGLLVWCEIPSAYEYSAEMKDNYMREMALIFKQKANHPCIITWVLFNESWGINEIGADKNIQMFADAMYYLAKSIDETRPVIVNDGWEHTNCDILTVHNYNQNADQLFEALKELDKNVYLSSNAANKKLFVSGYKYKGQPIIISEFGGCAFDKDTVDGWGYGSAVKNKEEFAERFKALYGALKKIKNLAGSCYTQFNDIQQEKNGLYTKDGVLKADSEKIKEILK